MMLFRDSRVMKFGLILFFLLAIVYAFYEGRGVILGPTINISTKALTSTDSFIRIKGRAEHITSLMMNGRQVLVTEDGSFDEPYVLAPGSNRIIFEAEDKYGRVKERVIEIVLTGDTSFITSAASTTLPASTSSSSKVTSTPLVKPIAKPTVATSTATSSTQ